MPLILLYLLLIKHHLQSVYQNNLLNLNHHNPEGPAIQRITEGDKSVEEKYFIFGHEKTKDEFKEYQSEKEGLPWYKNPSMKAVARF